MSATSQTSAIVDARYLEQVGVQFHWTGSPVGVFAINVSADKVNWNSISPVPTAPAGSAGDNYYDITITSAPYLQVVYTKTSGTGALTITITGKGA